MSVAAPSKRPHPAPASKGGRVGSDQLIEARIAEACKALWQAEVMRTILRLAVGSIIALLIWIVVDQWIYSPGPVVRSLAFVLSAGLLVAYVVRKVLPLFGSSIQPEYAARSLERDLPELRQSLTSYVTLRGDREAGDLRSRVVRSIGAETAGRLRAHDALPMEATGTLRWWIAAIAGLAVLAAYAFLSPKNSLQSAARLAAPLAKIEPPRRVSIRDVQPGNSEAIAGRSVEISAVVDGLRAQEQAICRWELPTGWQELELVDDPAIQRHSGQLQLPHSASGIVSYSILAGDATVGPFHLTVQDVPVVALESVHYRPPAYTGLAPYTNSSGAITAVDGTTVEILASTNRAVSKAKIEFNPRQLGGRIQATAGATEMKINSAGTSLSVAFPLRSSQGRSAAVELEDYRILVWDATGQGNPDPIVYPIRVVPDLPPEVSITVPASTPKEVPLDAQQIIEVHASDPDFGLKLISLEIRAGIDRIHEPVLWESPQGQKGHQVAEFRLRPAELQLRSGDTVQVVAIAVDNRSSETNPNIEPNVVRTDPITLKITASGEVPESNDPNADGLSSPDPQEQQAGPQDQQAGQDSGQQNGGAGGEGAGGAGGSGQSNQTQAGADQGEGTGGQGGSGESSQDSESAGGSAASEGASSPTDQQGQPDGGTSGSSDATAADADTNDGSSESQSAAESQSASDAGNNTPAAGDPSQDGNQGQVGDQGQGGNANPETGASGQTGVGENPAEKAADSESMEEGSGDSAGGSEGTGASSSANPNGQSSGSPSGQSGAQSGQPKQAPEHDGEAFERIRDFLEQQQQDSQGSTGSGSQSEPAPGQQAGSDRQDSGAETQDSGAETQDSSAETQDSGAESQSAGQQSSGAGNQSSGAGRQEQAGGSQRNGSETPGNENRDKGDATGSQDAADDGTTNQTAGSDPSTPDDAGSTATSGESSASDSGSGDQSAGQQESSATDTAQSAGQRPAGDQGADSPNRQQGTRSESASSESTAQSDRGEPSESSESSGEQGSQTSREDPSAPGSGSDSQSQPGSGDSTQTASPQTDSASETNSTAQGSSGGSGDGGQQGEAGDQPPTPPDPVNLDYAKQATDLVLDYLEQTRENPDPELLDQLQWSPDDLRRFAERWRQMRELSKQPGEAGRQEMEEALKSLGLRPQTGAAKTTRESSDALRGIRDAGNRQPPPAAFRDAFDAFRRAVGQPK